MEKLDKQIIYDYFESKGYCIIGEYKNTNTPVICEKDGYRYRINYVNLKAGKNPSLWGFHNISNLDYNIQSLLKKRKSKVEYLGYEIVTKNKKKRILLHFRCECGNEFDKILEDTVYKTYILCNDCTLKARGRTRRLGSKIIDFLENKGYKVLDKSKIYRNNDYVEVEDEQGFKGFVTYNHVKGRNAKLSKFDIRINKKHYIHNVNRYAELQNIDALCVGFGKKDNYTTQSLQFRCSCGEEFTTSIASFQNGKTKCEKCAKSISRYEFKFKNFLEELHIDYIYQYSYNQCRDILPLPFDFYLKKYKCLIEIDGEGHFHPCNFNQISNDKAQISFEITKKHDEIKNSFCKENNIPLLRIPYTAFQNNQYKEIFQEFIKK